jgi:hypothetical protein
MIEDGSINAYSIDDNGQLQYDEKKDLRFYDADGKIKDQLFLDAIKKQAIDDDTLGYEITEVDGIKTVVLKRGYTSVEINTIRNRGVSMLGALDKDAYAKWQQNVIFRSMFKFMPWLQAKKDLYFMERHESEILKVWKKRIDEFGNEGYVAEAMVQEGIVQSLFGLYRKFYAHGYKVLINGGIDDVEKKNMAVLASHLSLYAMTAIMYSMLKMTCVDEDGEKDKTCFMKHTAMGQRTEKVIKNIQSDLFVLQTFYNLGTGDFNGFAGFAVVGNLIQGILGATYLSATGYRQDEDQTRVDYVLESFNKTLKRSVALYRSGYEIYDFNEWLKDDMSNPYRDKFDKQVIPEKDKSYIYEEWLRYKY